MHSLQSEFLSFWRRNGGVAVLGYPMTEVFWFDPAEPGSFEVQYLERQRLEWHPELAGTAYEILLGRLGADVLASQDRDWTTFPTADPSLPHYVPETGHAIALQFWKYWSSHGLELGDVGTSWRESVALFGYPLSEPMIETNADGNTVLTQYFERAVFEFHPEYAGTAYEVLLRRVGMEALRHQGW
jgi:hypothetical protein